MSVWRRVLGVSSRYAAVTSQPSLSSVQCLSVASKPSHWISLVSSTPSLIGSLPSSTATWTLGGMALPVPSISMGLGGLTGLLPAPFGLSEDADAVQQPHQGAVETNQAPPVLLWDEFIMRMNRNKRKPKTANHGARPCSSVGRASRRPFYKGNPFGHDVKVHKEWPKGKNNRQRLKLATLGITQHRSYAKRMRPSKQRKMRARRPSQRPENVAKRAIERSSKTSHTGNSVKKTSTGLYM